MRTWILLAFGLSLAATVPANAALRCGSHLVSEGDSRSEVVAKCGEPTEINQKSAILRQPTVWVGGRRLIVGNGLVEIPIEVWIYNLGPNKLMRRLRFEDGVLVDIDTMGYGYYEER
jgi:hypothetical protein